MTARDGRLAPTVPAPEECWSAVENRDRTQDGRFVYAVRTTGVFCRPSCASRKPRRENVVFYPSPQAAALAGYRPCMRCRPLAFHHGGPDANLIARLCRFIEANLTGGLSLADLSRAAGLSPFHLQRKFKAVTGISPREYVDACRLARFKRGLDPDGSVTRAMTDSGYGASSRLYARTGEQMGMTPVAYRRGARNILIRFATVETDLGTLGVAVTARGVCGIRFGDSSSAVSQAFGQEFPGATLTPDDPGLESYLQQVLRHLDGKTPRIDLPLDIRATAFQRLVWNHLRTIPYGSTASYRDVAEAIGRPTAVRAVANACANNRLALAIPCHRVVPSDGGAGGFRWGPERKRQLLEREKLRGE